MSTEASLLVNAVSFELQPEPDFRALSATLDIGFCGGFRQTRISGVKTCNFGMLDQKIEKKLTPNLSILSSWHAPDEQSLLHRQLVCELELRQSSFSS